MFNYLQLALIRASLLLVLLYFCLFLNSKVLFAKGILGFLFLNCVNSSLEIQAKKEGEEHP